MCCGFLEYFEDGRSFVLVVDSMATIIESKARKGVSLFTAMVWHTTSMVRTS